MPMEISWEIRERAEGLYIIDGQTYEQVADRTGVSVTQLKRWGADGDWSERKKEYRRELSDLRRGTVQLRAKLLRKVLDDPKPDPQDVYAFARIEQVASLVLARAKQAPPETANVDPGEEVVIQTPKDAVAALQSALQTKINAMIYKPGALDFAGVKEAKQCMELIEKMRSQFDVADPDAAKDKGVDAATIAAIREQLKF